MPEQFVLGEVQATARDDAGGDRVQGAAALRGSVAAERAEPRAVPAQRGPDRPDKVAGRKNEHVGKVHHQKRRKRRG